MTRLPIPVYISTLVAWITAIDFEDWPQQHRLADGKIRPAMVTDLGWHDFGSRTHVLTQALVSELPANKFYNRMLSVVMPGHSIEPHRDQQIPEWVTRVHVPLISNPESKFIVEGVAHNLEPGWAYLVDTRKEHAVANAGDTPRIHFMFDVGR